eukprot:Pgem_evm1s865
MTDEHYNNSSSSNSNHNNVNNSANSYDSNSTLTFRKNSNKSSNDKNNNDNKVVHILAQMRRRASYEYDLPPTPNPSPLQIPANTIIPTPFSLTPSYHYSYYQEQQPRQQHSYHQQQQQDSRSLQQHSPSEQEFAEPERKHHSVYSHLYENNSDNYASSSNYDTKQNINNNNSAYNSVYSVTNANNPPNKRSHESIVCSSRTKRKRSKEHGFSLAFIMKENDNSDDYESEPEKFKSMEYVNVQPPFSIPVLVVYALYCHPAQKCTRKEVCNSIAENYSYYGENNGTWKKAVYDSLRRSPLFVVTNTQGGDVYYELNQVNYKEENTRPPYTAAELITY